MYRRLTNATRSSAHASELASLRFTIRRRHRAVKPLIPQCLRTIPRTGPRPCPAGAASSLGPAQPAAVSSQLPRLRHFPASQGSQAAPRPGPALPFRGHRAASLSGLPSRTAEAAVIGSMKDRHVFPCRKRSTILSDRRAWCPARRRISRGTTP